MAKYVYPAIFTAEKSGYSIHFPDLAECYTCGDDLEDGLEMAEDVLALTLYRYEVDGKRIPNPSPLESISLSNEEFVNYIKADTMTYRKRYRNKAIKKTLTIPEWLNEEAIALGVNFSQVLQEALLEYISQKTDTARKTNDSF